ncbi:MAG: hypothetical protein AVDCRST_MAG51-1223, partial [uncultured Ramlibacter sp.]
EVDQPVHCSLAGRGHPGGRQPAGTSPDPQTRRHRRDGARHRSAEPQPRHHQLGTGRGRGLPNARCPGAVQERVRDRSQPGEIVGDLEGRPDLPVRPGG